MAGQTIIEFREELLSLIEEANGDNIGVNDLICMMLQIGASDPALRRELGSIKNPTLITINDKIEGFNKPGKQSLLPPMGWRQKVLLQDVVKTHDLQRILSNRYKIAEVVNGADAPHCEAGALDAHGKITCFLSAPIRRPSSVIHIIAPVIFRRLAGNGKWLTHRTRSNHILQHLLWLPRCSSCLLYTSPSPRDRQKSRMPSSA